MATIKLSELNTIGAELFQDSESFIHDMNDATSLNIHGGSDSSDFSDYGDFSAVFGFKYLEYLVNGYAISNIKEVAKSFSDHDGYYY